MKKHSMYKSVLYIGTSPAGKGGMASVMEMYAAFAGTSFKFVCSHKEAGKVAQTMLALRAVLATCYYCLFGKIRIVHIHTASYRSFLRDSIYLWISKLFRKKVILHLHGGEFELFYKSCSWYCRLVCRRADCLVGVSGYFKSLFDKLDLNAHTRVLYNAIEAPLYLKDRTARTRKNVVFLGSINANKGIYDIIRCWEKHREVLQERVVLHIGGIGEGEILQDLIAGRRLGCAVVYHGWLDKEAKNRLLAQADIYLQPSYFESLGISILEAMSYAVPVVASDTGGIPDLVEDGVNGFLIHPGDDEALFSCLMRLLDDTRLSDEMGKRSLEKSRRFEVGRIKKDVEALYMELME